MPGVGWTTVSVTWPLAPVVVIVVSVVVAVYEVVVMVPGSMTSTSSCLSGSNVLVV